MHLDGAQGGFGRTLGSADPTLPPLAAAFIWETAQWVLLSGSRCRGLDGRFGLSGGPLLLVLRKDTIFCGFFCVFIVFFSYSGLVLLKT